MTKKYIAWDTSSSAGVVVAFEVAQERIRLISEWSLSFEAAKHSERLLWSIDCVLKSAGWDISQVEALGVGIGPGSFTGLRIGITTAKILAHELKIPVVGISSLSLLTHGVLPYFNQDKKNEKLLLIACSDATKGEWFTQMGSLKAIQNLEKNILERVLIPDEVFAEAKSYLKKNSKANWVAVGQSVERYPELWKTLPLKRRMPISETLHLPQPKVLAELMVQELKNESFIEPMALKPKYLRDSDAEVKLRKGMLKTQPITRGGKIA